MSERILITGATGQLGRALVEAFPDATAVAHDELDITDTQQLGNYTWSDYDTILNAAAYVNADQSETREGRRKTWAANATGPRNLAQVALQHNLHLVHYSSEYVFDGKQTNHSEDEPFSPLSVYGEAKAAADLAVSLVPNYHILRTTWVIGDGHNFVKTMAHLAQMRINPAVVDDQYGRLTFTSELARATKHLLDNKVESGTYNLSNSGKIRSFADIAALTFEMAGYNPDRVQYISTKEYKKDKKHFAPRPMHSDLDLTKIQRTGFESKDYEPLMRKYIQLLPGVE